MYIVVSEETKEVEYSGCTKEHVIEVLQSDALTHRNDAYNTYNWSTRGDTLVLYRGSAYPDDDYTFYYENKIQ